MPITIDLLHGLHSNSCLAKEYEEELTVKGTPFPQDADYNSSESDKSDEESDSDASEDDEDDAALLREYAKIKKEREDVERKKLQEKMKEQEEKQQEEVLNDNPLNNNQEDEEDEGVYSLKRKWYDETVFKNQARIQKKVKKRFINDTVRSDFHRNFLNRFIQ